MTRISRIRLAILVATASWFGFQQDAKTVQACNDFYCGNEGQCGQQSCCVSGGGTGYSLCDSDGQTCTAHTPCVS